MIVTILAYFLALLAPAENCPAAWEITQCKDAIYW